MANVFTEQGGEQPPSPDQLWMVKHLKRHGYLAREDGARVLVQDPVRSSCGDSFKPVYLNDIPQAVRFVDARS